MKVMIECPDFLMSVFGNVSLVINFLNCELNCKYCDLKFILSVKDGDYVDVEDIEYVLKRYQGFYDDIVISGGEPLLKDCIVDLVKLSKEYAKNVIIYTALAGDESKVYSVVDKFVVDVKGASPEEISEVCQVPSSIAKEIYCKYEKYKNDDKFVFRVSDDRLLEKFKFRNCIKYEKCII